jgi:hypothetical protein
VAACFGFGFAAPSERAYCVVTIKNTVVIRFIGYCVCAFVTFLAEVIDEGQAQV